MSIRDYSFENNENKMILFKYCFLIGLIIYKILYNILGPFCYIKLIVDAKLKTFTTDNPTVIISTLNIIAPFNFIFNNLCFFNNLNIRKTSLISVMLLIAMLKSVQVLLKVGLSNKQIVRNFNYLTRISMKQMTKISYIIPNWRRSKNYLLSFANNVFSSSCLNRLKSFLSSLVVSSILWSYEHKKHESRFECIRIEGIVGENLEDSHLLKGFVLINFHRTTLMNPDERNLKVGIISCKLEPPVYRSIHVVILTNFQEYFILKNIEHFFFNNLITRLKNSKIKILFFRWGSNNILESLLLSNEIDIIKWVGCIDLEIISIITKSRNISLINDINYSRVGVAHRIKEQSLKNSNKFLIIEGYFGVEVITILLFDSNSNNLSKSIKIMDTCIRSIQNFLKNKCLTYSTGIFELLIYLSLMRINKTFYNINNIFINTFVGAIETIPKIIGNIDTLKKAFTKNKLLKTQELNIDLGKNLFKSLEPLNIKLSQYYMNSGTLSLITL